MARQAAQQRRIPAQDVENEEAAHQPPAAPLAREVGRVDLLAAVLHEMVQALRQHRVEGLVAHDHVRLEVERQTQRIEVARTHGAPLVVHQRDLAVQRAVAVLVDANARMQQVVIQHARGGLDDRHVGLALQYQPHVHTAPRRAPQFLDEPVARKEVRVGDHDALARRADGGAVLLLDVVGVVPVVARDEHRVGLAGRRMRDRSRCLPQPAPEPARALAAERDGAQHELVDLGHDRPVQLHGVVLLGLGPEVEQVVRRVIDAADEGALAVDHHDLAVHAAEHVEPLAQKALAGVEHAHLHAGRREAFDELARQVGRTEAVDHQVDLHAAQRCFAHGGVQLQADLVLEQDEGLDDGFALRLPDGFEHARKEGLAVLEQLHAIAAGPVVVVVHGNGAQRSMSATSGAWSERCDHGLRGSTTGACTPALRT